MIIKKVSEFILFSNIFISFCAVALCIETNILLHFPLNAISFYCFVFGATLSQYNFHYLLKTSVAQSSQRQVWFSKRKHLHKILLTAGIIIILCSFLNFHLHDFTILSAPAVVAFFYSFPVIFFGKKKRIKDFGFLKIIALALVWTLVTVWFPVANFSFQNRMFGFIFLQRFVFIFILCVLFDLRDMEIDKSENINTVPVFLGKKNSYLLVYISLFIFILLSMVHYFYFNNKNVLAAMLMSAFSIFFVIEFSKKINSDFFYLIAVDGMMVLQALLVYVIV